MNRNLRGEFINEVGKVMCPCAIILMIDYCKSCRHILTKKIPGVRGIVFGGQKQQVNTGEG